MTERAEYLRALEWFQGEMDKKLSRPKNLEKGHWHEMGLIEIYKRIVDELHELIDEVTYHPRDYTNIISECCDVANFAMMLADLARAKRWERRERAGDHTLR